METEPDTVEPAVGEVIVTVPLGVGVAPGVGVKVGLGVGIGTPFRTFIVIVEDARSTLLLLYAFIETLCSPLATLAEFQTWVYGGEEAIQPLST
jgi:hypothetical protein